MSDDNIIKTKYACYGLVFTDLSLDKSLAALKLKTRGHKGFFLKKDKLPEGVHEDHQCFKTFSGNKLKDQGSFFLSPVVMVDDGLVYQELIYRYSEGIKRRQKRIKKEVQEQEHEEPMSDDEVQPLQ